MIDLKNLRKIGGGITERSRLNVGLTGWTLARGGKDPFGGMILQDEHRAVGVLASACEIPESVPDADLWEHVHGAARRLARAVLAGGTEHRPFDSPVWYAARILTGADAVRRMIREGKAGEAAAEALALGAFIEEARGKNLFEGPVLAHRRTREGAAKGGAKSKRDPAVLAFVKMRLKAAPSVTAASLWGGIPRDEFDALKVGNARLYREFGFIVVLRKKGKDWLRDVSVSSRTFRDYVKDIRSTLSR